MLRSMAASGPQIEQLSSYAFEQGPAGSGTYFVDGFAGRPWFVPADRHARSAQADWSIGFPHFPPPSRGPPAVLLYCRPHISTPSTRPLRLPAMFPGRYPVCLAWAKCTWVQVECAVAHVRSSPCSGGEGGRHAENLHPIALSTKPLAYSPNITSRVCLEAYPDP